MKYVVIKGHHIQVYETLEGAKGYLAGLCGKELVFEEFTRDSVRIYHAGTPRVQGVEFDPALNIIVEVPTCES